MAPNIDQFSASVGLIYEASLDPHAWPAVLKSLCEELGGTKGHIMYIHKDQHYFSFSSGFGFNPYGLNLGVDQLKRYFAEDPIANYGISHANEVFSDTRVIDPQVLQTSDMQQKLRGPMGIDQLLTVVIEDDYDDWTALGIYRDKFQPPFTQEEEVALSRYVTHIRRSTVIHKKFIGASHLSAIQETVLDKVREPLMIVDENLQALFCNAAAKTVMASSGSLDVSSSMLKCPSHQDENRLESAVASTFSKDKVATPRNAVKIGGEEGTSPLVLVITRLQVQKLDEARQYLPVTEEHFTATIPTKRTALITLCDPAAYRRGAVDILEDTFGLTPAESALADCLADDLSLKEAAGLLGRSVGTARVQLKSIFEKTDTNRQSSLIKLIMSIPG